MISQYYQQELNFLRELAVEFSQTHPALAPMLSGPSQDPDVERLLEGAAFLTGLLRQKLDDEFPEVVHGLLSLIYPHYLQPVPSATIMAFTPKPSLREIINVPAGTTLDSVPVDGTKCTFTTSYNVEVAPLAVNEAKLNQQVGRPSYLNVSFVLTGLTLDRWKPDRLCLHIAGPFPEAATIFLLLLRRVKQVSIYASPGGAPYRQGPDCIKPKGFAQEEGLLPFPTQSFPGYRILQEYFIMPEKFLFLEITGLAGWTNRGNGTTFELEFELKDLPSIIPPIKKDRFVLHATPAINVFPHDADPITLDHRQPEYRVTPSGGRPDHFQVHTVRKVTGFAPGTVKRRDFLPFELFTPQTFETPVYYINRRLSAIRSTSEVYLSVAYPPQAGSPGTETLSITLWCTNANLPENLKFGDITEPTSSSPELCTFRNILPPTSVVQPPLGKNVLWRLLAHMSVNLLSLANRESLKSILRLYIFSQSRDKAAILANEKRIDGIEGLTTKVVDRLFDGLTMRGQEIHLTLNPDHFASPGDMFLFSGIMDHFLGSYASLNCFTKLKVEDSIKGDTYSWPIRSGDHPLI